MNPSISVPIGVRVRHMWALRLGTWLLTTLAGLTRIEYRIDNGKWRPAYDVTVEVTVNLTGEAEDES